MKNVRLSKFITPTKYNITIKPDLEAFTFVGEEEIILDITKNTSSIILHSKEIEIEGASIHPSPHTPHPLNSLWAKKISYDVKAETATLVFATTLKPGKHALKLSFKGVINGHMRGFYKSSYVHAGKQKHLATSQFEATDARRAFPCFDEPSKKAIFELNFIIPENLTAISNTVPSEIREHSSGYKLVQFEPSPKMSTYLVALIVGDFEYLEGKTKDGVVVRVHTTPGKKHQGKFALDCAIKTLEFYNKYFDIPYPLKTLDMIAIPDFAHGAMENWGAVTYRESALLVDDQNSSASNKQWVALVIAHELAHQWFGNLVTMEWWTHLWLNEGFASYIEYLAVNELFPQWDIWTQFAYNDLGVALKLDALVNTHPIEVEVHHPNEIGEIFDEVSYSKGSSVIRMLADYLGEKDFRDGLRHYLKKHSYQNAFTEDLWQAFEKISKKPVQKMMQNWTSKPGYPVVSLKISAGNVNFSQKRFFSSKKSVADNTLWQVPVSMLTSNNQKPKKDLFAARSKNYNVRFPLGRAETGQEWIKINSGETSFFRTKYQPEILEKLGEPVRSKKLSALDRLGIIRDLFALAQAGEISAAEALRFAQNYKNETDYTVWVELSSGLAMLDDLLFGQSIYPLYQKFCSGIFKKAADRVGWQPKKGESHTSSMLRGLILSQAGNYGVLEVIKEAKKRFDNFKSIHPDLRGTVYSLAVKNGKKSEYDKIAKAYLAESLHEEKNRLGRAMGRFENLSLHSVALNFMMSKNVRPQDTPMMFASAFGNNFVKKQTWEFVKKHWPQLLKRYGHGGHLLARFIKPLSSFNTKSDLNDIKSFFKSHAKPGAERSLAQTLESIENNILWLARDKRNIENFLEQQNNVL